MPADACAALCHRRKCPLGEAYTGNGAKDGICTRPRTVMRRVGIDASVAPVIGAIVCWGVFTPPMAPRMVSVRVNGPPFDW